MQFELLDRYLLDGEPPKAQVVKALLDRREGGPAAAAFYEGMRILGARTPDLTLIALRLVLAGKAAEDERVVRMRATVEEARRGGETRAAAVERYREELA